MEIKETLQKLESCENLFLIEYWSLTWERLTGKVQE